MAVKTKEEILETLRASLGDNVDDSSIEIIEDISDTLDSLEDKSGEDWEQKYKENDDAWRKRYTDRFFNNEPEEVPETTSKPDEEPDDKPMTFDDLFSVKE